MVSQSIYVLHIITNISDFFHQKTCSICVNEFIDNYFGHFENGRWVCDEWDGNDIYYHRELNYEPPVIIVDLIMWMVDKGWWVSWMKDFDRIILSKKKV
jgi:hypothetical protein